MLKFAKSAYIPNAVDEGRNSKNNTKVFGFNAHAEGMNNFAVFTIKKPL